MESSLVVLHDAQTVLHRSVELIAHNVIDALESPDRIHRIVKTLQSKQWHWLTFLDITIQETDWKPIPDNIHGSKYIQHLKTIFERFLRENAVDEDGCVLPECFPHRLLLTAGNGDSDMTSDDVPLPVDPFAHLGYYSFDLSSGISKETFRSAMVAANLGIIGVDKLLAQMAQDPAQPSQPLFCLTRPPGHHACHSLAGGYCYINNAAVAADYLVSKLPKERSTPIGSRVVILDLDFHHGNGTQSIFYTRKEPAYISIHGENAYPYYTGRSSETGSGEGQGFNRNLPLKLRPESTRDDYLLKLDTALGVIKEEWSAQYLVISMGFDTFRLDPLGGFELDIDDYAEIGRRISALGLPALALLEGGYSDELGELVSSFLSGLHR